MKTMLRKTLLFQFIFFLSLTSAIGQKKFESGYILTNNGEKKSCLIERKNWNNNPESINYKNSPDAPTVILNIDRTQGFGIGDHTRYIKATVSLDQYGLNVNTLGSSKNPVYEQKTVLLKTLIEGDISLYEYIGFNSKQFYYKNKGDTEYTPIIYKKYYNKNRELRENNDYKNQLYLLLQCADFTQNQFSSLRYTRNDLIGIFEKYHGCSGKDYKTYKAEHQSEFNLSIKPGVSFTSYDISSPEGGSNVSFGGLTNFRIGVEAELFVALFKNNLSFFLEPNLHFLSGEQEFSNQVGINVPPREDIVTLNYTYLNLPLGARYYPLKNKNNSNLFLEAGLMLDLTLSGEIEFEEATDLETGTALGVFFGLGYKYSNYSIQARVSTPRDNIPDQDFVRRNANFTTFEIILGYSFL